MNDLTKWIDPRNWMWWALGAGAVVAGLWFGVVKPYNDYVTKKAVAAALKAERAVTDPAFNALTQQFKDIKTNIIETRKQAKMDADLALDKEKDRADKATQKFQKQVGLVKQMAADRQAILVDFNALPDSMWNLDDIIAANDGGGSSFVSLSGYTKRLIGRYKNCERDLTTAIGTAAEAVDRAAIRGAAVEALKRE